MDRILPLQMQAIRKMCGDLADRFPDGEWGELTDADLERNFLTLADWCSRKAACRHCPGIAGCKNERMIVGQAALERRRDGSYRVVTRYGLCRLARGAMYRTSSGAYTWRKPGERKRGKVKVAG